MDVPPIPISLHKPSPTEVPGRRGLEREKEQEDEKGWEWKEVWKGRGKVEQ